MIVEEKKMQAQIRCPSCGHSFKINARFMRHSTEFEKKADEDFAEAESAFEEINKAFDHVGRAFKSIFGKKG